MNNCSVTAIVAVILLAAVTTRAQQTPAPRIPLADLPTPADITAEYADDPPVVADVKRAVFLDVVRRAITRDMYSTESLQGDPALRRIVDAYLSG